MNRSGNTGISRDLGAALIIFIVYLAMLYVATRQPLYVLAGLGAGSVASVAAYYLFSHVRTRVIVWRDPLAAYDNGGYQVAQSLFAIGTGGWFGMGLFQGEPDTIPISPQEAEELAAKKKELGTSCMKDFSFHTAHLKYTISRFLINYLGEDGQDIVELALQDYVDLFGQEYLDVLEGLYP